MFRSVFYLAKESVISANLPGVRAVALRIPKKIRKYSSVEKVSRSELTSNTLSDDWKSKIIYNDIIQKEKNTVKWQKIVERRQNRELLSKGQVPEGSSIFMNCMGDKQECDIEDITNNDHTIVHFPYESTINVQLTDDSITQSSDEVYDTTNMGYEIESKSFKKYVKLEKAHKWRKEVDRDIVYADRRFGSCDPNVPVSNVTCGGCGALLHCKATSIPGFVPKEVFEDLTDAELRGMTCQRCIFLEQYNVALGVNVNPDEYPKILQQIKGKQGVVILVIDLLDFPCSVWPKILNVIGEHRQIFVVGNKVDLLIQDGKDHKEHIKNCLCHALELTDIKPFNIQHIEVISAKTGFGVERLINKLFTLWDNKGDLYIVGCTNAGKSTLFNTLIQSDFCQVKAADVLQRATVSLWPGTTLNLLKFPVLKPSGWHKYLRTQRLIKAKRQLNAFENYHQISLRNQEKERQISLIGYMGRSFPNHNSGSTTSDSGPTIDLDSREFLRSNWCFDTPGVVHEAQILNILTVDELSKVLPQTAIIPRNFRLQSGHSLFIGGIGRLDLLSVHTAAWFTVYASKDLPVTIVNVEDADYIYNKLLGTQMLVVPQGNEERMKKWLPLKSEYLEVVGKIAKVAGGDVILSSAGWIAVTVEVGMCCKLRAWTPGGRGIFLRDPPLIRYSSRYKGKKIFGTPAYSSNIEVVNVELND